MLHLVYMNSTSLQENFIHLFKKKKNYILIGNVIHGKLLRKKARFGTAFVICYHVSKRGVDIDIYLNIPPPKKKSWKVIPVINSSNYLLVMKAKQCLTHSQASINESCNYSPHQYHHHYENISLKLLYREYTQTKSIMR